MSYIIICNNKINLVYAAGHMKYESPIVGQHHPDLLEVLERLMTNTCVNELKNDWFILLI